jgi:DegV family protein with EDD domain
MGNMTNIVVSCDSVCVLPEKAVEYGLVLASYSIALNGKYYQADGMDTNKLYAALEDRDNLPTTSMPNVGDFQQLFTSLADRTDSILHVCITSAFNKSYQNALSAKKIVEKNYPGFRIEIVDSRTTGMGVCLIAREALRWVNRVNNIDEVLKQTNAIISQVRDFSARDTLFYLDKGGRIFEAKSWSEAENKASFRSIIEIDAATGGTVKPIARVKTETDIIRRLVELTRQNLGDAKSLRGDIGYSMGAQERAERLKRELAKEFSFERLDIAEVAAVVAVHNGRGFLDYTFVVE